MPKERLQKIIARAGITSRRKAEAYITEGRVRVDGKVMSELGAQADLSTQVVEIDGYGRVEPEEGVYILLHKPPHVVCTVSDPERRTTVIDLLQNSRAQGSRNYEGMLPRVYPVGRLDYDTQGAILLTNDGELSQKLLHPRHHVPKVYMAKVQGHPEESELKKLRDGVYVGDPKRPGHGFRTKASGVRVAKRGPNNTWIEITLAEGRNHQVKRMCEAIGHRTSRLIRIEFAGLDVNDLPPGGWRFLTKAEVAALRQW